MSGQRFDQSLRRVEFQINQTTRNLAQVWMRERMIADVVTLGDDAFDQLRIALPVLADDEERRRDVFLFQYIQDAWRPLRVWAIIKGQRDRSSPGAVTANDVRRRNRFVLFVIDQMRS